MLIRFLYWYAMLVLSKQRDSLLHVWAILSQQFVHSSLCLNFKGQVVLVLCLTTCLAHILHFTEVNPPEQR